MPDSRTLASIRRALGRHESGRGKRYPSALKARATTMVLKLRDEGLSWAAAAAELGLRTETARRWCRQRPAALGHRMRRVEIVTEQPGGQLVLVTPSGLRLEGCTLDDVASLLRALA